MRRAAPALWLCTVACFAGCAASLHQVPVDQPHGIVELRFEHANRDLLYDNKVRIDGGDEVAISSGQRVRLAPGTHTLELVSIGRVYGVGTVAVTKPGTCVDPQCTRLLPTTEYQPGLVETDRRRCAQLVELKLDASRHVVALLRVAADQTCSGHVAHGRN